jgi:hypothetical protein
MDFESTIPNATKREILLNSMIDLELDIYRLGWATGNPPDTLSTSYTSPAVEVNDPRALEQALEAAVARHVSLKTERDSIPT